jgi:hypothetical protein
MREEWRQWWDTIPQKGREYHGHFRMKPDKIFQTDNRILISTITQLRTGHGYFNSYLSKIPTSNVEDRGCSCSGTPPQTPAHLILRCQQHAKARMIMRRETPRIPKLRLDLLLYTNMGAKALAKYLQTTKVATRRWKLGIDNKPANPTNAIGWGTLDQPQDEHHDGSSGETGDEAEENCEE